MNNRLYIYIGIGLFLLLLIVLLVFNRGKSVQAIKDTQVVFDIKGMTQFAVNQDYVVGIANNSLYLSDSLGKTKKIKDFVVGDQYYFSDDGKHIGVKNQRDVKIYSTLDGSLIKSFTSRLFQWVGNDSFVFSKQPPAIAGKGTDADEVSEELYVDSVAGKTGPVLILKDIMMSVLFYKADTSDLYYIRPVGNTIFSDSNVLHLNTKSNKKDSFVTANSFVYQIFPEAVLVNSEGTNKASYILQKDGTFTKLEIIRSLSEIYLSNGSMYVPEKSESILGIRKVPIKDQKKSDFVALPEILQKSSILSIQLHNQQLYVLTDQYLLKMESGDF